MSTISAGTTSTTALVSTGDTTGNLVLATGSVPTTALTLNSTTQAATFAGAVTAPSVTTTGTINATNTFGFKNRVINGGMTIDQRYQGASLTVNSTTQQYPVDRFYCEDGTDGVFTVQQNSSAPTGFTNSVVVTVTTPDTSLGGTQYAAIAHQIEGYNIADLSLGTASAKTFTLSFWVQSSVTGTFGGSFRNAADNRCYPFSYVINVANTWEQKTITVAGDTTGTWLKTNGIGLKVWFSLAAGATWSGPANAWASTLYVSTTGATNLLATNGATFYITGVQLEVGSQATSWDFRSINQEFTLCQRYYQNSYGSGEAITSAGAGIIYACSDNVGNGPGTIIPVPMRTSPTIYVRGTAATTTGYCVQNGVQRVASAAGQTNVRFAYLSVTGGVANVYTGASYEFIAEL